MLPRNPVEKGAISEAASKVCYLESRLKNMLTRKLVEEGANSHLLVVKISMLSNVNAKIYLKLVHDY